MGVEQNIDYDVFPNQSNVVGTTVDIMRVTETGAETVTGTIVRDDVVAPFVGITELEDGTVVMDSERDGYVSVEQGSFLGKKALVCFNYDTSRLLAGEIVRDDAVEPFKTVIKLEVGRLVLATECQYSPQ